MDWPCAIAWSWRRSRAPAPDASVCPPAVAFACSLAMTLPISTPPNAIAHASGLVDSRQMVKPGLIIGISGLLLALLLLYGCVTVHIL